MTEFRFEIFNIEELKNKVKGFKLLFGENPDIYITGTFQDNEGSLVFFDNMSKKVFDIRGSKIKADVDGKEEYISFYSESCTEHFLYLRTYKNL